MMKILMYCLLIFILNISKIEALEWIANGDYHNGSYLLDNNVTVSSNTEILKGETLNIIGSDYQIVNVNGLQLFTINEGAEVSITRINIQNGSSLNNGSILNNGELTVLDTVFINNIATGTDYVYGGGAIYNQGKISDLKGVFGGNSESLGNRGTSGGAIYNQGSINSINSSFLYNKASYQGGGIYNQSEGIITSLYGIFERNISSYGGAISNQGYIGVLGGIYKQNGVSLFGGAISNRSGILDKISGLYEDNVANSGGAIENSSATINSIEAIFSNNIAYENGGAIYNENAQIYALSGIFENNSAGGNGGAIFNDGGVITIVAEEENTLFKGNLSNASISTDGTVSSGVSNALHNQRGGIINLKPMNAEIIFNDAITGDSSAIINILGDGKVILNNNISGNDVNINSGILKIGENGSFSDTSNIVVNSGILDIGNRNIRGNSFVFNSGSTLLVNIDSVTNYGNLSANNFVIQEGALFDVIIAQGVIEKGEEAEFKLFVSENDFIDNFALNYNNKMYDLYKKENYIGVYGIKVRKTGAEISAEYGGTKNNINTAQAWIDGDEFYDDKISQSIANNLSELAQTDGNLLNKELNVLAPSSSPLIITQVIGSINKIYDTINDRYFKKVYRKSSNILSKNIIFWGGTLGNYAKGEETAEYNKFEIKSLGFIGGIEKKIGKYINMGIGYSYWNGDIEQILRKIDLDDNVVFLYSSLNNNNWFMNVNALYSLAKYKEKKYVFNNIYKAEYDVKTMSAEILGGYIWKNKIIDMIPDIGLRYYHINRDGYKDTAYQRVDENKTDILNSFAGIKIRKEIELENMILTPYIRIGMLYDIKSGKDNAMVYLTNGSNYFIEGSPLNRFALETNVGVEIDINDNWSTNLNYLGNFREKFHSHSCMINLKYIF